MNARSELLPAADCTRIMFAVARPYRTQADYPDILLEARRGVLHSLDTYDLTRGCKPATHAMNCARKFVRDYWRENRGGLIRIAARNHPVYSIVSYDEPSPHPRHNALDRAQVPGLDTPENLDRILLHQALALIPSQSREVLQHLYLEDESQSEYGRTIGLTQMGVSHRRNRALGQLRRAMRLDTRP